MFGALKLERTGFASAQINSVQQRDTETTIGVFINVYDFKVSTELGSRYTVKREDIAPALKKLTSYWEEESHKQILSK